jgi:nitric oxide reductase large subunit
LSEWTGGAAAGPGLAGKHRNPFVVWLLLPIITLGIYHLVWYYKVNNEARRLDRRIEVSPGVAVVAITLGAFVIVPPFVSYYRTGQRIAAMQRTAGLPDTCSALLGLVLQFLLFGSGTLYYQFELNKIWSRFGNPPQGTRVLAGP